MIKKEDIKTMGKAQLKALLFGIPRLERIETINRIISKNRNISVEKAKKQHYVLAHEVKEVLYYFGFIA